MECNGQVLCLHIILFIARDLWNVGREWFGKFNHLMNFSQLNILCCLESVCLKAQQSIIIIIKKHNRPTEGNKSRVGAGTRIKPPRDNVVVQGSDSN